MPQSITVPYVAFYKVKQNDVNLFYYYLWLLFIIRSHDHKSKVHQINSGIWY